MFYFHERFCQSESEWDNCTGQVDMLLWCNTNTKMNAMSSVLCPTQHYSRSDDSLKPNPIQTIKHHDHDPTPIQYCASSIFFTTLAQPAVQTWFLFTHRANLIFAQRTLLKTAVYLSCQWTAPSCYMMVTWGVAVQCYCCCCCIIITLHLLLHWGLMMASNQMQNIKAMQILSTIIKSRCALNITWGER